MFTKANNTKIKVRVSEVNVKFTEAKFKLKGLHYSGKRLNVVK